MTAEPKPHRILSTNQLSTDRVVLHTRTITGAGGGPEKTILNSPRFLRKFGYQALCLYLHPSHYPELESLTARARDYDAELIAWVDGRPFDFKFARRLADLCRQRNVAVWHAHDYKTNLLGLMVRRYWPMKLVTTCHGWIYKSGMAGIRISAYNSIGKACLPFYDAVICVSQDLAENAARWRVKQGCIHLVHNAIDTEQYRRTYNPLEARRALGLSTDQYLVVGLGRLSPEKGFEFLVEAVARLIKSGVQVTLCIGGEGACRADLIRQIADGSLQNQVTLLGHVPDPRLLLQAADVFVLSSTSEGLPNVVLEALALETPVVSTKVAGVPSVIRNEREGLLVPIGDATALFHAIERLLKDPLLRQRLAEQGRERIQQEFDFNKRMQKIVAIYNQLLGVSPAAVSSVQ